MRTESVLLSFSEKKFIGQKLAPELSQLYQYLGPYLDIPNFLDHYSTTHRIYKIVEEFSLSLNLKLLCVLEKKLAKNKFTPF